LANEFLSVYSAAPRHADVRGAGSSTVDGSGFLFSSFFPSSRDWRCGGAARQVDPAGRAGGLAWPGPAQALVGPRPAGRLAARHDQLPPQRTDDAAPLRRAMAAGRRDAA